MIICLLEKNDLAGSEETLKPGLKSKKNNTVYRYMDIKRYMIE